MINLISKFNNPFPMWQFDMRSQDYTGLFYTVRKNLKLCDIAWTKWHSVKNFNSK